MTEPTTRTHRFHLDVEAETRAEAERLLARGKARTMDEALEMARLHLEARRAVDALPSLRKILDDDGGPLSGQQP